MFPAGDKWTQSWKSFLILTELRSVKSSLILPVPDTSADDFVINSISSRAAAATCLQWSSTSCSISNSRNLICFSFSRRCLAMRSFASCCFPSSSILNLDISKSRWRWLDLLEEVFLNLILIGEIYCSTVSLSGTELMYPQAEMNLSVFLVTVSNLFLTVSIWIFSLLCQIKELFILKTTLVKASLHFTIRRSILTFLSCLSTVNLLIWP